MKREGGEGGIKSNAFSEVRVGVEFLSKSKKRETGCKSNPQISDFSKLMLTTSQSVLPKYVGEDMGREGESRNAR